MNYYEDETAVESGPDDIPDWNPIYDSRAPQLGQYQPYDPRTPQLNVPTGPIDWDYVSRAVSAHERMQSNQLRRKAMEAKVKQDAIRFAGQQEMEDLIKGGATPSEAYRRVAHKINYNDPDAYVKSMMDIENSQPFTPKKVNIDGVEMLQTGKGQYRNVPRPPKPEPDQTKILDEYLGKKEHTEALQELERAKKPIKGKGGKLETDHEAIRNAARRTRLAEENLRGIASPKVAESKYPEGTRIRSKKDGKLYIVKDGIPVLLEE